MRLAPRVFITTLVFALVAVACSGDDGGEATTTTAPPLVTTTTTSATGGTGSGTQSESTTTTSFESTNPQFPDYEIVRREVGDSGDTVVVLLDADSYERALTDIDLENVLADVVEQYPPVYEAYVVDSQEAASLVLLDTVDDDQQAVLDEHYLVHLEEGFRIVFSGPFADVGVAILGS